MNQELANRLNEEGAIVIILNMQKGAEIGLDYNSWLVGEQFMGFKMVLHHFKGINTKWWLRIIRKHLKNPNPT